jgi:hypothetical protein
MAIPEARWYVDKPDKPIIRDFILTVYRKHLYKVLTRSGPYSDEDWVPGLETIKGLETPKIL